ncbi:GlxA family transcriptional regulator [Vibrio sp. YIC-376]|uniref:GlxA family transcriptional regulator n=1 Tax=Vibrio sp. YIC-376 TaxID=3136162 RepID=UPI00402ABC01
MLQHPKNSPTRKDKLKQYHIGFLLQPNFSMMAFTAAIDSLITANLVHEKALYNIHIFGIDSRKVLSDIGIEIVTDSTIESLNLHNRGTLDWLFVCGGYRCDTSCSDVLKSGLRSIDTQGVSLGSIWNGTIALAHADALSKKTTSAVHPSSHSFIRTAFPEIQLSSHTFEVDEFRASCAGPNSALEMMLNIIDGHFGPSLVRAVREILSCDQASEGRQEVRSRLGHEEIIRELPETLKEAVSLMASNVEEPLTPDELARCISISRRQLERLFQLHLDTSPSRYYIRCRLARAHDLLENSRESIIQIGLSCGFVSSSHFSNCFKDLFSYTPTQLRQRLTLSVRKQ